MCGRNMSRTLFLWLLLVLGNLLKNASHLVCCLTLLEEGNHSERVDRHRLVQVGNLVLVRLRLCKEDLFTLLLRRGYIHHSTEVVALEIAEKLYSTTHVLGEVRMNVRVLVLGSTSTHECRSTGTWLGVLVLFTYFDLR
jgi:hypothetical protein